MAGDYSRLLKQDFSDMTAAAESWQKVSFRMDTAYDQHRTKVSGPLHASWEGDDAEAALRFMEDVEARMSVTRVEAMTIFRVIHTVRWNMEAAQTKLRNAVKRAEEDGYVVDDSGSVMPALCDADVTPDEARAEQAVVDEYQARINEAITEARQASDDGNRALSGLNGEILDRKNTDMRAESAHDRANAMEALGLVDPQVPEDPEDAAAWWSALSPEEQREYATLYPGLIGPADGLPSDVRDDANRLSLEQSLSFSDNGLVPSEESREAMRNLQILKAELDEHDGATGNKKLYLLDYDGYGDGRTVIAMGNPDTADNVSVQVPGTATTMGSTGGQLERISKLQDSAEDADPSARTSMVYWLGYDAPEVPVKEAANLDVGGTGRAEDAAPDLRGFTHGLRASHEGEPANLTVLGHSYGSTAVGAAASGDGGLDADNIVVVGSPGMTVDNAAQLNIDPDHVYAGLADDDPISAVSAASLGQDPASVVFGGTRFETDTSGHSGYWDEGSESLANQGRIIAGQEPADRMGTMPLIPGV